MRSTLTLLGIFFCAALFAQSFNGPESVEYDAANHRWLVSNHNAGTISAFYPQTSTVTPFASGMTSGPHGLEIMGSTLYACDGGYIRGFDLSTGSQVFSLNLSASFLNGLTSDGVNYLFATDFSAKKIYRICPATNSFNLMTTTVKTPNGIFYDGANNRCVFVTWGSNAPIQAMSLADSTITTVRTTTLSNCDGITRDMAGNWYVSAWGTNSLNRTDAAFSAAPVSVMTGLNGPADLGVNTAGDSIAIPNSNGTTVVFYVITSTGIAEQNQDFLFSVDPLNGQLTIDASNLVNGNGTAYISRAYSVDGKLIATASLLDGRCSLSLPKNEAYVVTICNEQGVIVSRRKVIL